jgi:hypothetical protein
MLHLRHLQMLMALMTPSSLGCDFEAAEAVEALQLHMVEGTRKADWPTQKQLTKTSRPSWRATTLDLEGNLLGRTPSNFERGPRPSKPSAWAEANLPTQNFSYTGHQGPECPLTLTIWSHQFWNLHHLEPQSGVVGLALPVGRDAAIESPVTCVGYR